jgi:hypothetical protein
VVLLACLLADDALDRAGLPRTGVSAFSLDAVNFLAVYVRGAEPGEAVRPGGLASADDGAGAGDEGLKAERGLEG